MKETKEKENESTALKYLGISYVKIPRVVLNLVFSREEGKRQLGRLYLAMFTLGNFAGSTEVVNEKRAWLERGELWVSLSDLSKFTGIHISSVRRHLVYLKHKGLVEVVSFGGRSRIHILGYDRFTAPGSPAEEVAGGGSTASSCLAANRVAEEEARVFGERKQRMDLVNYGS